MGIQSDNLQSNEDSGRNTKQTQDRTSTGSQTPRQHELPVHLVFADLFVLENMDPCGEP